jgi:DNA-binding MarR family transcriptional regulator
MFDNKAIMMSSESKVLLIAAVGKAVQAFQDATDAFDEAAASKLGLNRTDLRCLAVMAEQGPVSVGDIGKAIGLTRGATTTALDRVERAGYARRVRHPSDRRGVLIEMTDKARTAAGAIWGPVAAEGERMMAGASEAELKTILTFLQGARSLQLSHLAVLDKPGD